MITMITEKKLKSTKLTLSTTEGLTPLNRRSLQTVQGLYCLVEFGQVTLPLIESIKQWQRWCFLLKLLSNNDLGY